MVGFFPSPVTQAISKGAGLLSIGLGVAAVIDGCVAYRFDGICIGEAVGMGNLAPIFATVTTEAPGPMGGIPGVLFSGVWLWAEQYRGPVPELR